MMNDAALEDPTSLHLSSEQQLSSHLLMVAPTLSQFVVLQNTTFARSHQDCTKYKVIIIKFKQPKMTTLMPFRLVIYQTRERVCHQDILALRSGLKKQCAAEFFLTDFEVFG